MSDEPKISATRPRVRILWLTRRQGADGSWVVEGARQHGEIQCPRCGAWAPLVEDVDEYFPDTGEVAFVQWPDGTRVETGWGPGVAEHCGLLLVNDWDAARAIDLGEKLERQAAEDDARCPRCDGYGEVQEGGTDETCPDCSGVGWLLDDEDGDDAC